MKAAHGKDGIEKLISLAIKEKCETALDVGAGKELTHVTYMKKYLPRVYSCDFFNNSDYIGDFNKLDFEMQFDVIHAAHVLEHQLNVNLFLRKINSILKENGLLCITVPPLKHRIVGGHVTLWNAGLIIYNLVLAGFDCSNIMIKQYNYNISVILKKKAFNINNIELEYDSADLDTLKPYLPKGLKYGDRNTFNGNIMEHNWK